MSALWRASYIGVSWYSCQPVKARQPPFSAIGKTPETQMLLDSVPGPVVDSGAWSGGRRKCLFNLVRSWDAKKGARRGRDGRYTSLYVGQESTTAGKITPGVGCSLDDDSEGTTQSGAPGLVSFTRKCLKRRSNQSSASPPFSPVCPFLLSSFHPSNICFSFSAGRWQWLIDNG